MAAAFLMDTPSRVLRRVQQLEEMEMPSLPSFQGEIDFGSTSVSEAESTTASLSPGSFSENEIDPSTPHPLKQAPPPSRRSMTAQDTSSSTSGSPFPPLASSPDHAHASPYVPVSAVTSTPVSRPSRSQSRTLLGGTSIGQSTFRQDGRRVTNEYPDSSLGTGKEEWQTPGEMSGSFSGENILPDLLESSMNDSKAGLGEEKSIPLNDESIISSQSRIRSRAATPITQRLAASNVILQRPGRRSAAHQFPSMAPSSSLVSPGLSSVTGTPQTVQTAIHLLDNARIPSLTRSEVSESDSSRAASTPDGPSRILDTVRSSPDRTNGREDADYQDRTFDDLPPLPEEPTYDYDGDSQYNHDIVPIEDTPMPLRYASPAKTFRSSPAKIPSSTGTATPGVARRGSTHEDSQEASLYGTPAFALRDITTSHQDSPMEVPFTPSPAGLMLKANDLSTPRAPLDDAERRKNHVLAVLGSSGLSKRTPKALYRGTPHPLRRVSMPPSSPSLSDEESLVKTSEEMADTSTGPQHFTMDVTQASSFNESFVSIASSSDLTFDRRATTRGNSVSRGNTSFPTLLLPTAGTSSSIGGSLKGYSDQRADGVKIQRHLNAMNKQLLDDNANLAREAEAWRTETDRLRELLRDAKIHFEDVDVEAQLEQPALDVSGPRQTVGRSNGASDPDMTERLHILEEEVIDKGAQIAALEAELQAGRSPSFSDLQARVEELNAKLEEAEKARSSLHVDFALKTEKHAQQFGDICSDFESQVKSLESELAVAKGDVARLKAEKAASQTEDVDAREKERRQQIVGLEVELSRAREEVKSRINEVEGLKRHSAQAQEERRNLMIRAEKAEQESKRITEASSAVTAENAETRLVELETALNEVQSIRKLLETRNESINELQQINDQQETELASQRQQIEELATKIDELEASQPSQGANIDRLQSLLSDANNKLSESQGEIESLRNKLSLAEEAVDLVRTISKSPSTTPNGKTSGSAIDIDNSLVHVLQDRLDEAYHEIGRLKHDLANTPHRKTAIEVRDARIEALEREKAALAERLVTKMSISTPGMLSAASPFKPTPLVHKAIASLKDPKTPGPLKDLSWLNSTIHDSNEPILRAQLEYLEDELANANEQLDDNFSRLEAAGISGFHLAEQLAAAQDRIEQLEDELRGLSQRNKASLALVSAQREESGNTKSKLQEALEEVHQKMEALRGEFDREKARLQKDNERLSRITSEIKLHAQDEVESIKHEMEKLRRETDREVQESEGVKAQIAREKEGALKDLQESSLRVRQLERDLATQRAAYDELSARQTRHSSAHAEISQKTETIRNLQTFLQEANSENERLRANLRFKIDALGKAEQQTETLRNERAAIVRDLLEFEVDLKAQRAEAVRFGNELAEYKAAHDGKAAQGQSDLLQGQREYRLLKEKLDEARRELESASNKCANLERWRANHSCQSGLQSQLDDQKLSFKAQTRELATQIRYLKAKFTREATFRNALALQKRYLLLLVGGMSLTEQATLKQIASMGFPVPPPPGNRRTFKAAALAVVAVIRTRAIAAKWKAEVDVKSDLVSSRIERKRMSSRE